MWKEPLGGLVGGVSGGLTGVVRGYYFIPYSDPALDRAFHTSLMGLFGYLGGTGFGVALTGHFIEKNQDSWISWVAAIGGSIAGTYVGGYLVSGFVAPVTSILGSIIVYRLTLK